MNRNRDIEYEMSRFEAEITKLAPPVHTENVVIAAPPVNAITIKTPMNFQMNPTMAMIPSQVYQFTPSTSYAFQGPQIPIAPNPFLAPAPLSNSYKPPTVPKIVTGTFILVLDF